MRLTIQPQPQKSQISGKKNTKAGGGWPGWCGTPDGLCAMEPNIATKKIAIAPKPRIKYAACQISDCSAWYFTNFESCLTRKITSGPIKPLKTWRRCASIAMVQ